MNRSRIAEINRFTMASPLLMIDSNDYLDQRDRQVRMRQDRRPKDGELAEEAKAEGVIGVEPLFHL